MANKSELKYFIRFGELPVDGRSISYREDGIIEKLEGVSVFNCAWILDRKSNEEIPVAVMPFPHTERGAAEYARCTYNFKGEGIMYLVTGTQIDEDDMHCPIIKDVEIVCKLGFDKLYPERRISEYSGE